MSWQDYVDQQICPSVPCSFAIVAGLSGGEIWANYDKDVSKPVTTAELKVIADTMKSNPGAFHINGIHLAGEKYVCLHAENELIRGRKGSSPLIIVSTKECMLVVAALDGFPAGKLNTFVEKLGDYLRSVGS